MAPYLGNDVLEDEFGDVDDDDLLRAESSISASKNVGGKRPAPEDFDDTSQINKPRTDSEVDALNLAQRILKETWGFPAFRLKQEAVITRLIAGGSAVVIFPTGGGKSLVYQVPALAFNAYDEMCGRAQGGGVTLVVSPLIALMKVSSDFPQQPPPRLNRLLLEADLAPRSRFICQWRRSLADLML